MATTKKAISSPPQEPRQEPQPEPTEEESFLNRGHEICTHLSTYGTGKVDDVRDLHGMLLTLLRQISSLFEALYLIADDENEVSHNLCFLSKDLALEVQRRVD